MARTILDKASHAVTMVQHSYESTLAVLVDLNFEGEYGNRRDDGELEVSMLVGHSIRVIHQLLRLFDFESLKPVSINQLTFQNILHSRKFDND